MEYGEALAKRLPVGAVVSLEGPLGAGKTHLAKGLAKGFGFGGEVASPTFALIHEYPTPTGLVLHADFYRIESEIEVFRLGFEELISDARAAVVEWGDRFPSVLPKETIRVRISDLGNGTRSMEVSGA